MTNTEIIASVTHHYIVVSEHMSNSQLREHKRHGSCPACDSGQRRELAMILNDTDGEKRQTWPGDGPCALCYMRYWHTRKECTK